MNLIKVEISNDNQNEAANIVFLNGEIILHTNNDSVTLSAVDHASDGLEKALSIPEIRIDKTTEENVLEWDWDEFYRELQNYVVAELTTHKMLPEAFTYQSVVFKHNEYEKMLSQETMAKLKEIHNDNWDKAMLSHMLRPRS